MKRIMSFYTNNSKNNNNNKPVVNIITIIITISLSGFGGMLPQKIFKSQNPKNKCDFYCSEYKRACFSFNLASSFGLSATQSTPTSNEQVCIILFAHKQILHKPIKKCVKK